MDIKHTFDDDHDFFTLPDAPERSTGWIDGWRVEIDHRGNVEIVEFFDAEKNTLHDCSPVPGSDLADKVDEVSEARFEAVCDCSEWKCDECRARTDGE